MAIKPFGLTESDGSGRKRTQRLRPAFEDRCPLHKIENAKAVCRQCEAQTDCLEFAIATNQDSGIWGGTSEEERRQIRKQYAARQRRTA